MAPGDFVRTIKQLADLVGQVSIITTDPEMAASARAAVDLLRRDVVAAGIVPGALVASATDDGGPS
ncbi:hypothetical protein [Rhodopila sp.]|uniref:hypothetical protein n=1 Tax=Rhodopila sp. TaxID=2480087 RepID=UPI003D1053BB